MPSGEPDPDRSAHLSPTLSGGRLDANLEPEAFLKELLDHYLFATLHELAYESLLAECRYRMQHLESAGHRIDERIARLKLRRNTLRQEEITEELEIILLNTVGT